jgi:hypothetical protein
MRRFAAQRSENLKSQLSEYFDLNGMSNVVLSSNQEQGHIRINRLDLNEEFVTLVDGNTWTGQYFDGVPVALEAVAHEGYHFSGWYDENNHLVSGLKKMTMDPQDGINLIATYAVGDEIPISDEEIPLQSYILYTSLFVASSIAITFYILHHQQKKHIIK